MRRNNNYIDYIEFPAYSLNEFSKTRVFLSDAFSWSFEGWGSVLLILNEKRMHFQDLSGIELAVWSEE